MLEPQHFFSKYRIRYKKSCGRGMVAGHSHLKILQDDQSSKNKALHIHYDIHINWLNDFGRMTHFTEVQKILSDIFTMHFFAYILSVVSWMATLNKWSPALNVSYDEPGSTVAVFCRPITINPMTSKYSRYDYTTYK